MVVADRKSYTNVIFKINQGSFLILSNWDFLINFSWTNKSSDHKANIFRVKSIVSSVLTFSKGFCKHLCSIPKDNKAIASFPLCHN